MLEETRGEPLLPAYPPAGLLVLLLGACRPGGGDDSRLQPSEGDDTAPRDSTIADTAPDDTDTGDSGPDDTGPTETGDPDPPLPGCVSYTALIAQCAARVTPGTRTEGYEDIAPDDADLLDELHAVVSATHDPISYDHLWDAFPLTDARADGTVWDVYSDASEGAPAYTYAFGDDQCGEYDGEGDCYNREHLWAQNWTSGGSPFKSDLNHMLPTDGWVNNIRGNLPFGPVSVSNYLTTNGSRRGSSALCAYRGEVFEPIDAYKGDIARALLYVHVRYTGEDSDWGSSEGTTGAALNPWFKRVLIAWSLNDPVSDKERARNDVVEGIQGNRNPFIDHPEYVCGAL